MDTLGTLQGWLQLGAVGIMGYLFWYIVAKAFPLLREEHAAEIKAARDQYAKDIATARQDFRNHIESARAQWREEGLESRAAYAATLARLTEDSRATRDAFLVAEKEHQAVIRQLIRQIDELSTRMGAHPVSAQSSPPSSNE